MLTNASFFAAHCWLMRSYISPEQKVEMGKVEQYHSAELIRKFQPYAREKAQFVYLNGLMRQKHSGDRLVPAIQRNVVVRVWLEVVHSGQIKIAAVATRSLGARRQSYSRVLSTSGNKQQRGRCAESESRFIRFSEGDTACIVHTACIIGRSCKNKGSFINAPLLKKDQPAWISTTGHICFDTRRRCYEKYPPKKRTLLLSPLSSIMVGWV